MALKLYFDKNIGARLPEVLDRLELDVAWHMMKRAKLGATGPQCNEPLYRQEETDDVWLADVGAKDWVVFSHDRKFHKPGYEPELSAIKQYGVGCFYLWGANASKFEKAKCFFRAHERVLSAISTTPRPFIFDVLKNGTLKRIQIP